MKRIFDFLVAFVAIIILIIPMIVVGITVFFSMGRPILFKQKRPGLYGEPFYIYKFRTMTNAADEKGVLLPNKARLTKMGKFLRKTSLDELPQFFNVLKGELSLVGPRPLRMEYLSLYTPEQARRQNVVPGITGWAQVNGRNSISWERRFELDLWYVDHQSFTLDIKIIWMTLMLVLKRKDVTPKDEQFIERFKGGENDDT